MIATLVFHFGRGRAILTYAVKSRHKREEKTTHTHDTPIFPGGCSENFFFPIPYRDIFMIDIFSRRKANVSVASKRSKLSRTTRTY